MRDDDASDRHGLGPLYAIRLGELRDWHYVVATCFQCRHAERISPKYLRHIVFTRNARLNRFSCSPSMVDHEPLRDIQRHLACRQCGNRAMNSLAVKRIPRNA